MAAYIVFTREKMRNRDGYERYREKSRPANAGHPLKPLALYGRHEMLEGPAIEGAVISGVSQRRSGQDLLQQPRYQEAARHRFLGADYRAFIVEGV